MRGTILAGAVVALGLLSSPSYAETITLTVTPNPLDPLLGQFGSISASPSTLGPSGTFTGTGDFSLTTTGYASETIGFLLVGSGGLPTGVTLDLYEGATLIETATESGATSITLPSKELVGGVVYDLVLTGTSKTGTHASVGINGGIGTFAAPELSTWGMLTLGFAGLGYAAFRRKAGNRTVAAI